MWLDDNDVAGHFAAQYTSLLSSLWVLPEEDLQLIKRLWTKFKGAVIPVCVCSLYCNGSHVTHNTTNSIFSLDLLWKQGLFFSCVAILFSPSIHVSALFILSIFSPICLCLCVCVCVCKCTLASVAVRLTWLLVDISSKQPISCLLGIWSSEIELSKVGHVKHGHIVSTWKALALNLRLKKKNHNTHIQLAQSLAFYKISASVWQTWCFKPDPWRQHSSQWWN